MKIFPLVCVAALAAGTSPVRAQVPATTPQDFPAERLRITPNRAGIIDTIWAGVPEHLSWDVGVWTGWAANPLVAYRLSDDERLASFVSNRLGGAFVGSLGLWGFAEIAVELPAVFHQGNSLSGVLAPGAGAPSLSSIGVADLRVMPKLRALNQKAHGVDLAVIVGFTLPTGGATSYFGDAGATFAPELAVSRRSGALRVAANAGGVLRETRSFLDQTIDSELNLRLAGAWRSGEEGAGPLELGTGISSAFSLSAPLANANQNHVEWRAQGAYDVTSLVQVFGGAGLGLANGWGTPDWRAFAGVRFGQWTEPSPDTDGDGIADKNEARPECITQPEDEDSFEDSDGCPDPDNDQDGVLDVNEARPECVNVPEDKDAFEDADGCVDPDNDQDGVLDTKEARPECVNVPEDKDGFEDADGCVDPDDDKDGTRDVNEARPECRLQPGPVDNRGCPDSDGDKDDVVDRSDNCPTEPGPASNQGCPAKNKQLVVIKTGRIEILDTVYFALDKDEILAKSFPLLDNVAQVITGHPEIAQVRIEGHTDNQGKPAHNLDLSDRRAKAVKKYLIGKGVDESRLVAKGWGQEKPIADNKTAPGRAKNRRVEFNVVNPGDSGIEMKDSGPTEDTMEKSDAKGTNQKGGK